MPAHNLTRAQVAEAVAALKAAGGNQTRAARSLGIARATFQNRIAAAERVERAAAAEADVPRSEPDCVVQPPVKPHYRISQDRRDGLGKTRVLAIGDAHDSPSIPKDRFRWMGRYAADIRPDMVVQIGDFLSLDSLCRYVDNASLEGKSKTTLKADLESFKLALDAFAEGQGDFAPEKHVALGNHEDRIWSFTDRTPEVAELLTENLHTILTDRRWSYSPFGALHFVGGVAFTHSPLNTMGKPYGGMYAENQMARDSLWDLVCGHSHKRVEKTYPKLNHRKLTVLNLGCALPDGHIEQYARHSLTGWDWGVYDLTIQNGAIKQAHWVPMTVLEERYG